MFGRSLSVVWRGWTAWLDQIECAVVPQKCTPVAQAPRTCATTAASMRQTSTRFCTGTHSKGSIGCVGRVLARMLGVTGWRAGDGLGRGGGGGGCGGGSGGERWPFCQRVRRGRTLLLPEREVRLSGAVALLPTLEVRPSTTAAHPRISVGASGVEAASICHPASGRGGLAARAPRRSTSTKREGRPSGELADRPRGGDRVPARVPCGSTTGRGGGCSHGTSLADDWKLRGCRLRHQSA